MSFSRHDIRPSKIHDKMKIKEIPTYFTETIFKYDEDDLHSPFSRWFVRQYKLVFYTARGVMEHGTMVRSAALTFYTLMSLVPIVAVAFAIVKGFGLADTLTESLYDLFPNNPETAQYLLDFAEKAIARTRGGLVATVALITLLWAVIRVLSSIESAFNAIWEVKIRRSMARQYTDYIAILFIVPILWITANAVGNFAQRLLGFDDSWYYMLLSKLISLIVVWFMFTLMYVIIPSTKVNFGSAFRAGIFTGTLFLLFQWGYIYLQQWMTSYNAIYGSFVALPLLLVWMQTSWQILLFGAELSFAYQNISRFDAERESLLVSHNMRRRIILAVMLVVVRNFRNRGGALPAEEIRRELKLPTRIVNDVLYQLVEAKQLIAVSDNNSQHEVSYTPAYEISQMTFYGIIQAVEECGGQFRLPATHDLKRIDEVLNHMDEEYVNKHKFIHVTDLI